METYEGNSLAWMLDNERERQNNICSFCECYKEHRCLNCACNISEKECEENDGICSRCIDKGEENGIAS